MEFLLDHPSVDTSCRAEGESGQCSQCSQNTVLSTKSVEERESSPSCFLKLKVSHGENIRPDLGIP